MAECVLDVKDVTVCGDEVEFYESDVWFVCGEQDVVSPDFDYADVEEDDVFVED